MTAAQLQDGPAILSLTKGATSLYTIREDGQVWTDFFPSASGEAEWNGWFSLSPDTFPITNTVTAVSTETGATSLYAVKQDGQVWTNFFPAKPGSSNWNGWLALGPNVFPVDSHVTALSLSPGATSLYIMGVDGKVWTNFFPAANGKSEWNGWFSIGDDVFPIGNAVSAVSTGKGETSLYAVKQDGHVWTNFFPAKAGGTTWSGWLALGPNVFPNTSRVTALSLSPGATSLYIIGVDGQVWSNFFPAPTGGSVWSGWFALGGHLFPTDAVVSALSTGPGATSLYAIDAKGEVWTNFFPSGPAGTAWSGWLALGPNVFPVNATVSVASTSPGATSLYVKGLDGQIWTNFFPSAQGQKWSAWLAATPWASLAPIVLTQDLVTGGLAALGGSIKLTINADGSVRWQGHAHDSGADGYDYSVSVLVTTATGASIAMAHSGTVGGTFESASRDDDWDITYPNVVTGLFASFDGAVLHSNLQYTSDFGSFLSGVVDWALKFVAGSTPVGIFAGFVIFVGAEVYSLIATGSLVAGAIIAEDVLWMAGPFNTLISLGAAEIVKLGSNSRQLTQEEYDWANGPSLYAGALPGIGRIVVTDTINGDRAFTFPRWNGTIALNLGPAGFKDPRNFPGHAYGEILAHELLHACQIAAAPSALDLMACAISAKVCGDTSAYTYPNAGPEYVHFGLEQQAQIVGDWASGTQRTSGDQTGKAEDPTSPYYTYIVNNVRTKDLWATL